MLTVDPTVPLEARRKVLVASTSSSNNNSSSYNNSTPVRAKVDLGSVTSPTSPSWQPGQPVRAKIRTADGSGTARSGGYASAPVTPAAGSSPFGSRGGTPGSIAAAGTIRATLSPNLSSSSRAPSPVRSRSPEGALSRSTPLVRTGPRMNTTPKSGTPEPSVLRGQSHPFPSTPSTVGTATPISHLPSSVSVRRIHSPTLRSSTTLNGSSTVSRLDIAASLLALSPSASSVTSSPLNSPNVRTIANNCSPPSVATFLDSGSRDHSVDKAAGLQTSGASSAPIVSSCDITPTSGGLLPSVSLSSDLAYPRRAQPPTHPPHPSPLMSPPLQPIPVKSPTLSSFPSSRSIKAASASSTPAVPSLRPPLSAVYPANKRRHARSNSVTSTSSLSSALSAYEDHHAAERAPSWSRARVNPATVSGGRSRPASPTHSQVQADGRSALNSVDWSSFSALEAGETPTSPVSGTGRVSSGSEVSGMSVHSKAPPSPRKEIDDKEREARVERKILDLEITNSSLLSINASLERDKLKQASEIRELRRRMRESIGGAGLAALRAQAAALDERAMGGGGDSSDPDDEEEEGEGEEPEASWQELLDGDEHFSAVAATLESLVRRAKTALEYVPATHEGGRVLSTVEQEDRLEVETVDQGVQTDPPAPSAGRGGRGLGIVGWQKGR
ncbi:hypothetical protein JCM11641_000471 [Rhodosporidiobolus odoratus]